MGPLLSGFGALLGSALWVGITYIPIPLFLAGLAAAGVGLCAGYGMRWGGKEKASRPLAAALSLPGALLGAYGAFVTHTVWFRLPDGSRKPPAFLDPETRAFFLRNLGTDWLLLLCFAIAAWFAWRSARA